MSATISSADVRPGARDVIDRFARVEPKAAGVLERYLACLPSTRSD